MAKAKKAKVKRKVTRKPKDPCGARLKKESERHHDWHNWSDECCELKAPAVQLREVVNLFKGQYRDDLMSYLGMQGADDETDMYEDFIAAVKTLDKATKRVEDAEKQMKQRFVAEQRSYQDPKTKEWRPVSTGPTNTTLLSQYPHYIYRDA